VFFPALGAYFVSLREARGWNQSQAGDIAARRKIPITYQALRGLEEGKTKSPEPELLRAVSELYDVPYEQVVGRVLFERYGVTVQEVDVNRKPTPTVSSVPSTARLLDERRRLELRAAKQLQKAMTAIGDVVIALRADPDVAKRSARDKRRIG
jgi:transcriptional regulator with XRE-family HTH domain